MRERRLWQVVGTTVVAMALVLGSTAAAYATPTPDEGPVAGGTTVTLPAPEWGLTFTAVSYGLDDGVALGTDGNTYAWGSNRFGQVGDGTTTRRRYPVRVQTPAGVTFTAVTSGWHHTLAVGSDGNAYAWGYNGYGQLGDGTNTDSSTPVQVLAPAGVTFTEISAHDTYSLALSSDGDLYAWGSNQYGQLGNGTYIDSNVPVRVQAPAGVIFTAISAGRTMALALDSDGNAYSWGSNYSGELGDGTNIARSLPVRVHAPAGVTFTEVSAGQRDSSPVSLAIGSDGNLYSWGQNDARNSDCDSQLGDGTTIDRNVPVRVLTPAGVTFTAVSTGGTDSYALDSDGNSYAWGCAAGYVGTGDGEINILPTRQATPAGVTFTSLDSDGGALSSDGDLYIWGDNSYSGDRHIYPVPTKYAPPVWVYGVTFDGTRGTNLVDNGDGTVSVDTPAHAAGPVDVAVEWSLDGIAQPAVIYTGGFTYVAEPVVPTVTDPVDQSVSDGGTAVFSVVTTGSPSPSVVWEVSRDGGVTWESITADPAATASADGLTLSVVGSAANDGFEYRAVATNSAGAVTSGGAALTVTATPVEETPVEEAPVEEAPVEEAPTEDKGVPEAAELAFTGSAPTPVALIAALLSLLLGAGLLSANRAVMRRVNR